MTSDAKVGLLLGLLFIFLIAFVLNGLPSFHRGAGNNELTEGMVGSQNNPPGLGVKERRVKREFIDRSNVVKKETVVKPDRVLVKKEDVRFEIVLPKAPAAAKQLVDVKSVALAKRETIVRRSSQHNRKLAKSRLPRFYVVRSGDSLAAIAKKVYGYQQGNRRVNIARIFEANRKLLKSANDIYVGQKLRIPAPVAQAAEGNKANSKFSSDESHATVSAQPTNRRVYVVKTNDSLWRIAAEQLGNGGRYGEIARLNAGFLSDADNLVVGMRLKLPVR